MLYNKQRENVFINKGKNSKESLEQQIFELKKEIQSYENLTTELQLTTTSLREAIKHASTIDEKNGQKEIVCSHDHVSPALFDSNLLSTCLPESAFHNQITVDELVNVLEQYDVISFDIFDTLIFRGVSDPKDVFCIVGQKINMPFFEKYRTQAEQEARKRSREWQESLHNSEQKTAYCSESKAVIKKKNLEVNIDDIYTVLNEFIRSDMEKVKQIEFETEKEVCHANPYMKKVYDKLISDGKTVVLTSDMYWPSPYLDALLKSCGYADYEKLFVSCEYLCNKGTGKLQKCVQSFFGNDVEIVHVGDNHYSDIEASNQMGWDAVFYENPRSISEPFWITPNSKMTMSLYRAVVSQHLHCDDSVFSKEYEYGFKYAGLLTYGFCEWIDKLALQKGADKILFLARDMDIFHKIYKRFFNHVSADYVYVSRMALSICNFEYNPEEFIRLFFESRSNMGNQRIIEALEETDLSFLADALENAEIDIDTVLNFNNYALLHDLLMDNYEKISEHFRPSVEAAKKYFTECIGNSKHIFIADLGWNGSIFYHLQSFIQREIADDIDIIGAYVCLNDNKTVNDCIAKGNLYAYTCCNGKNMDLMFHHENELDLMASKFIEATFTSAERTLLKYGENEYGFDFTWGIQSVDTARIQEIQAGILSFANLFNQAVESVHGYISISPYDGFLLLRQVLQNPKYGLAILGNALEWEFPLPRFKGTGTILTLGTMLRNKNLL